MRGPRRCSESGGQAAIETIVGVIAGMLLLGAALGVWVWFNRMFVMRSEGYHGTLANNTTSRLHAAHPDSGPPGPFAPADWYVPNGYELEELKLFATGEE